MNVTRLRKLFTHRFSLLAFFGIYFALLLPFYYNKFLTFGCFDDCFNFMGGYFLLQGKTLFSEVFYNHQPLMAYVSFAIQTITTPESIYQLVLYHRLFIYGVSFLLGLLLVRRFGFVALGFLFIYEPTKYYVFGDRFLAEGIIVYLLAYLLGLTFSGLSKNRLSHVDMGIAVFFTWIIVFMREPFIPLAGVLFMTLLVFVNAWKKRIMYLLSFIVISLGTVALFPLSDYWFNVVTINQVASVNQQPFTVTSPLYIFFYPLLAVFPLHLTIFGRILSGLSLFFLIISVLWFFRTKRYVTYLWLLLILGLANLRYTQPGLMYYEAFHMLVWYGLFLMTIFLLLAEVVKLSKSSLFLRFSAGFLILITIGVFSPRSFFLGKTRQATGFRH